MTFPSRSLLVALLCLAAPAASKSQGPAGPKKGPPAELEQFRALDPAERLRVVERAPGPKADFRPVARGDLTVAVIERGSLEAAVVADLACRLKARGKDAPPVTIKWIVDEGTPVKKGDRLVELEDAVLHDQHGAARVRVAEVDAARVAAAESVRFARRESDIDVRLAEIAVELAAAERKDLPAGVSKAVLDLKVEQSRLLLERAKAQAQARLARAEANLKARSAATDLATERLRALEAELGRCVLTAPIDGMAVYPAPASRFGAASSVAVGEPVREGQTLIRVANLDRLNVLTRVHEAQISSVRADQVAEVRIDAFPERVYRGKVTRVATVASQPDWIASDVKVYPVTIALDDGPPGMKPGMSAEVRILIAERKGVLQVPVQAIVRAGRDRLCFVKADNGLQERKVVAGVASNLAVEITDGLKEGDLVLANPQAITRRATPRPEKGGKPPQVRGLGGETHVIVARSVRPPDDSAGRSFVQTFGLTHADLHRFAALPAVTDAVPLRIFPASAIRAGRLEQVTIVATTPVLAERHRLEPMAGRFLSADDDRQMSNVAVLGRGTARAMFADTDPLGQSIALKGHSYQVVGVLDAPLALPADVLPDPDRAVFIPLRTSQARFGDRVVLRTAGSQRVEAVQLHTVVLHVDSAANLTRTADAVRSILTTDHAQKDWQVVVPD